MALLFRKKYHLLIMAFCSFIVVSSVWGGGYDCPKGSSLICHHPVERPAAETEYSYTPHPQPMKQADFVGVHGGWAIPGNFNSLIRNGYIVGLEWGYRDTGYRGVVTIDFMSNQYRTLVPTMNHATYNIAAALVNIIYDFNYQGPVIPFLGGGLGYTYLWRYRCFSSVYCSQPKRSSQFAYQAIGGLGFMIDQFRLDLRYRFFSFPNNRAFYQNIAEIILSYYYL